MLVFLLNDWLTPPEQKSRKFFSNLSGTGLQATHLPRIRKRTAHSWMILAGADKKHHAEVQGGR